MEHACLAMAGPNLAWQREAGKNGCRPNGVGRFGRQPAGEEWEGVPAISQAVRAEGENPIRQGARWHNSQGTGHRLVLWRVCQMAQMQGARIAPPAIVDLATIVGIGAPTHGGSRKCLKRADYPASTASHLMRVFFQNAANAQCTRGIGA